jgi:hypothetical protein
LVAAVVRWAVVVAMKVGIAASRRSVVVVAVVVGGWLRVVVLRVVVAEAVPAVRARRLAAGSMRWMTIFRFDDSD